MTNLQVTQPVFTLVLDLMFLLRATMVRRGVGHSRVSRNTIQTKGRIITSKKSEQTNQISSDAV